MSIKKLVFVTGNENKLREVKEIVGNYFPFRISNMKIDLPEYQGHADDISKKKCLAAAEIVHGPVMIEDTCLCFNAYKGLPGPYIKWFLDAIGCEGLFKMLTSYEDKSATAVCTFAVCLDPESKDVLLFKGVVLGNIVFPRGNNCFGWDPIFEPKGFTKTFGELDKSEKNTISHRYKALEALRNHFTNDEADSVADASS